MLAVKAEINESASWIYQIDHCICILFVTGREDANLILRSALSQALTNVRPQIYARFYYLFATVPALTHNLHYVLGVLAKGIGKVGSVAIFSVQTVGQCFI